LQAALGDASEGRENPILERAKFKAGTTSPRLLHEQQHLPLAAALAALLVNSGTKTDEAYRFVGSRLDIDPKKLRNYKNNLSGRKLSKQELVTYNHWYREFRNSDVREVVSSLSSLAATKS
jgi:hypothetical protein